MSAYAPATANVQPLTTEQIMYLKCFVKAHQEGQFVLTLSSVQEARRVKMGLNRAKKKLLEHTRLQEDHPEFKSACLDTSVSIKTDPDRLVLYRTDSSDFNRRLMAQLGMTPADNKLHEEKALDEGQERLKDLMRELEEPVGSQGKLVNPFADVLREE